MHQSTKTCRGPCSNPADPAGRPPNEKRRCASTAVLVANYALHMANIVLVAGTFHGGWYWDPILAPLEQAGHAVYAPTLTGLEPESANAGSINLDTHIDDVLRVIDSNGLTEVMLVGWSYGGMVITGVADRTHAHVKKLVYLDGQLPEPGQSEWHLMSQKHRESALNQCLDGISLYPDAWLQQYEPRTRPHPIGTKLQPLTYDQTKFNALDKIFIFAEKWFHDPDVPSPIEPCFLRARDGNGWAVQTWPVGHDVVREAAQRVSTLLCDLAKA